MQLFSLTFLAKNRASVHRTRKMKPTTLPKKVIPLAELSILDVVFALSIPSLLDFLNRKALKKSLCGSVSVPHPWFLVSQSHK